MPIPPDIREHRKNPWPEWPLIFRTEYGQEEVKLHYGHDPRAFNVLTKSFIPASCDPKRLGGLRIVSVRWEESAEGQLQFSELPGKFGKFNNYIYIKPDYQSEPIPVDFRNWKDNGMWHGFVSDGLLGSGENDPGGALIGSRCTLKHQDNWGQIRLFLGAGVCCWRYTSSKSFAILNLTHFLSFILSRCLKLPSSNLILTFSDCRRGQSLVVHAINEGRQAARQVDVDLMGSSNLPGPGGVIMP